MLVNWGWRVAHGVRWRYRWFRGEHGEFSAAEQSGLARDLTSRWDANWEDADPDAVVWGDRTRHVRFHSLPGSKQYADTDAERAEILRRHLAVLAELQGAGDIAGLVCIATDYGRRDLASGWTRTMLPERWPWRYIPGDDGERASYLWVEAPIRRAELEDLLAVVADDEGREGSVAFTNSQVEWLYCPYAGGADVVLPTSAERDRLKALHPDWLSAHPEGL